MHIGDITAEAIVRAQLKDKAFEYFVRKLLDAEVDLRHSATASPRGPVAPYRGDDKRDLIVEVRDPPRLPRNQFPSPLTWDEPGQTWYSCKGGSRWGQSFLDELGASAAKSGRPPGKGVKKRPPQPLLQHLSKARRLVFVAAAETLDNDAFLAKAEHVLGFWLDHLCGGRPATLRDQLDVIDAHALARFIAKHRPSNLGEDLRRQLGITAPNGFHPWNEWTNGLGARELTTFETDATRTEIIAAIEDPSRPVLRVFGPPGTGKTRVVHEGIQRLGEDARARVHYCSDPQISRRLGDWVAGAGAVWLVLDELRTNDVEDVVSSFRAHASAGARLFLIGTSDDGSRSEPGLVFALGELDDAATERVIRHEFGRTGAAPSNEQVELVRTLSEHYPWYAVLLARALAREPESIARGDDDTARWNVGAKRVIADHRGTYASTDHWEREAELRAKCLLVAMMTRDLELPWDEIWEHHGEALALALREPHDPHQVQKRALVCIHRQLLRQSGARAQRRYVSPNNLARIILNHFLGPGGPDLGPTLRRHAPQFRGALLDIAKSVHAHRAVEELARGEWEELARRTREDGVESASAYLSARRVSYQAAVESPEAAAWGTSQAIAQLESHALASASQARGVLRQVLAHLTHRAISTEAFLAVEASLFDLAQLDDKPWANNATGIWKHMFLPALHQTHHPWALRLGRLDERLADRNVPRRTLAIEALALAVSASEASLGHVDDDLRDGQWSTPTIGELAQMKDQLWSRLLDACDDPEEEVSDRARRSVTGHLRPGIGRRLHAPQLRRIAVMASSWTIDQRRVLIEKVDDVRRYDGERIADLPEVLDALAQLETALAPTTLHERIVVQVGTWAPGPWRIDDDARPEHEQVLDRALARELVEAPEDHDAMLTWLLGPQASRSRSFLRAWGFVDHDRVIHRKLVALVREGARPQALSDYLLGWADDEGVQAPEAWIEAQASDCDLAQAFVEFLVMQAPSSVRLARLHALLAKGAAGDGIGLLAYRGWAEALPIADLLPFIRSLVARTDLASTALPLLVQLLDRDPTDLAKRELVEILEPVLHGYLAQRVVIASQDWFERGVLLLANEGRLDLVVALIVRALDVSANPANVGLGRTLLVRLLHEGFAERLWPHLTATMLDDSRSLLGLQLAHEDLLRHFGHELVLAWVGTDLRRAKVIADLCNPHEARLDEIIRQLLLRFGPDGAVADVLESRANSTPGGIEGSVSTFERRQWAHAIAWARDPQSPIRRWAQRLEQSFRRRVEEDDARGEYRRRYG